MWELGFPHFQVTVNVSQWCFRVRTKVLTGVYVWKPTSLLSDDPCMQVSGCRVLHWHPSSECTRVTLARHCCRIQARQFHSLARTEAAQIIFGAACSSHSAIDSGAFPSSSHLINEANAQTRILHHHTNSLGRGGHKLLDSNVFCQPVKTITSEPNLFTGSSSFDLCF